VCVQHRRTPRSTGPGARGGIRLPTGGVRSLVEAAMDYSIRPLCFSHVDLPREFFGGVPIHSGEGVSSSPMIYVLLRRRPLA
jgi:hypothetical protein